MARKLAKKWKKCVRRTEREKEQAREADAEWRKSQNIAKGDGYEQKRQNSG